MSLLLLFHPKVSGGGPTIISTSFSFAATSAFNPSAKSIAGGTVSIIAASIAQWTGASRASSTFSMAAQSSAAWGWRSVTKDSDSIIAASSAQWSGASRATGAFSIAATSSASWIGTDIGGATIVSDVFAMAAQAAFNPNGDVLAVVPDSVLINAQSNQEWECVNVGPIVVPADFSIQATSDWTPVSRQMKWLDVRQATWKKPDYKVIDEEDEEILQLIAAAMPMVSARATLAQQRRWQ